MAYKISSSTFSISSPLVIKNGTEGYGKILTTDASGLVVWKEPKSFFGNSRYVGELYGGGIVIDFWKDGSIENVLIMSLTHLSYNYVWSNVGSIGTGDNYYSTGAVSLYDGRINSDLIISQTVYDFNAPSPPILASHSISAAKLCKDYNYGDYDDWYLPSYDEFVSIAKNKYIINRVLGDVNGIRSQNTGSGAELAGLYWTSTEYSEYQLLNFGGGAFLLPTTPYGLQYSTSEGKFKAGAKTSSAMVRAVRREEKSINGLVLSLDAGNKNSYDDSTRGNIWYDIINKGITASSGVITLPTSVTYSSTNGGYFTFNTNSTSYIDFNVDLNNSSVATVEMFVRLKSTNGSIFTWGNGYSILNSGPIGFYTGSADAYGISQQRSVEYSLLNNWKHYVFVMRTDVSYTNNKIYVNGDQIVLVPNGGFENTKSFFNGVGKINPPNAGFANGAGMDLAVLNIYKRELNQTEILNNFNTYKKRFEIHESPYQKDLILNLNSNNINSFNPSNLTIWNDTKFSSDTRTLKPVTFASSASYSISPGVYPGTYINFSNNRASVATAISFTYSTTWEIWIKFDSIAPEPNLFMGQTLPYFSVSGHVSNKFLFSNSYSGAAGGSNQTYHNSNSSAIIDKWYHVVFTTKYDPVSNLTSEKIYINGKLDQADTLSTNDSAVYDSDSIPGYQINTFTSTIFAVGDGRNSNWYPFKGSLSEVRIYNRTLNLSEVKNNYNSSKHLYDIDKNHYTHNIYKPIDPSPTNKETLSIFQNLVLDFPNKQNNSILVSNSSGLVSLSKPTDILPDKVAKKSVGDLYGGGIIVSVLESSLTTDYLIASLYDLPSTYYWSTLAGSQSFRYNYYDNYNWNYDFMGSSTTALIIATMSPGGFAAQVAATCSINGYNDWYLPSIQELREVYNNLGLINISIGKNSFVDTYWSSTPSTNRTVTFSGGGPFPLPIEKYIYAKAFNFGSVYSDYYNSTIPGGTSSGLGVGGATSSGSSFDVEKYAQLKVRPFRMDVVSNSIDFIMVFKTDNVGTSGANQITIPTRSGLIYNYNVDWGDNTTSSGVTGNITHTYPTTGTYTVKIRGIFPTIYFSGATTDKLKILEVKNWGSIKWSTMENAFINCSNLKVTAKDAPDLSNVTNMSNMFSGCASFNQSINHWNVSNINYLISTFYNCSTFNQPLNSWNVSNVTDMNSMFSNATVFNQPLNSWNTSEVTSIQAMFQAAEAFNNGLASGVSGSLNWNTIKVTNMQSTFASAKAFNQNIGSWNTSIVNSMASMFNGALVFNNGLAPGVSGPLTFDTHLVQNMNSMFNKASAFNQTLTTSGNIWNVSLVTNMGLMFGEASAFNQPLNSWNTQSVIYMEYMFYKAIVFNNGLGSGVSGPLTFDTHLVQNMNSMFRQASAFNQTLTTNGNIWNVSAVTDMSIMFNFAIKFNQSLNSWNTSSVINMEQMFYSATVFNNGLASGVSGPLTFDTHLVTNMSTMFYQASAFNQTLTTSGNIWNTSSVLYMQSMFTYAIKFNQSLNSWNTSSVINMGQMFGFASVFNNGLAPGVSGPLTFDTHLVQNMHSMFRYASAFNQTLTTSGNIWNVSLVTNMGYMFNGADLFNQPLSTWNVSAVTDMGYMFNVATGFNQNIGSWNVSNVTIFTNFMLGKTPTTFSAANLDAIYIGWITSPKTVKPNITIDFGAAKRTSASTTSRNILTVGYSWVIYDGGI